MRVSELDALVRILKVMEGCRLKAYQDSVGVWTIGYGETLNVKEGDVWTPERAVSILQKRAALFASKVEMACQGIHGTRLIACASLAYNIGIGAFKASSICRKTNLRDYSGAADSFLLWNKAKGKILKGLTVRRNYERRLYLSNQTLDEM